MFKRHFEDQHLFQKAIFLSVLLHAFLWVGFSVRSRMVNPFVSRTIEIDLTQPFRLGGSPLLKPGGGTLTTLPKVPGLPQKASTVPEIQEIKPKEWILPGPDTKSLEKPLSIEPPIKTSPTGLPEGIGEGTLGTGGGVGGGHGQGGGIPLTQIPQLLNRSKVLKWLQQYYPYAEREAGIEGVVVVDLHLNVEGRVVRVDIIRSAGESFDQVAERVAKKMQFSPAKIQSGPIPVKIRQSITFNLEEE
jgi:TonB family protein